MTRVPRRAFAVLLLLPLVVGVAAAGIEERPLRAGSGPLALAFDEDGMLWVTLDRAWAVGRYDPASGNLTEHPLTVDRRSETDELSGIHVAADAVWTASATHLHRVDRATGNVTSYELPTPTDIAGDVIEVGGRVYVAGVTSDKVSVFDPVNESFTEVAAAGRSGPLGFVERSGAAYVSLTYSGAVARVGADGLSVETPGSTVRGPVGLAWDGEAVWVAEMGSSSVARLTPATGDVERWPTSPSPFYVISGPSDVLVDGGKVWFAEHFADRIGLLDPEAGTLVEWMAPSAPGANLQRVALAPDGNVWFAEWSKDRLGFVTPGVSAAMFPSVPVEIGVPNGTVGRAQVPGVSSAASESAALKVGVEAGEVALDARGAAPGAYRVLVSVGDGRLLHGRYVTVTVTEPVVPPESSDTSALAWGTAALAAVVTGLASPRRPR